MIKIVVKGLIKEYYSSAPDCRFMIKKTGANTLYCIGRNPSFGSVSCTDPTLSVVEAISSRNGFDGWAMLNLYPQRDTANIQFNDDVMEQNALFFASHIPEGSTILAAWGEIIGNDTNYRKCLRKIKEKLPKLSAFEWLHLGKTQSGHPRMPCPYKFYFSDALPELQSFEYNDVESYFSRWCL